MAVEVTGATSETSAPPSKDGTSGVFVASKEAAAPGPATRLYVMNGSSHADETSAPEEVRMRTLGTKPMFTTWLPTPVAHAAAAMPSVVVSEEQRKDTVYAPYAFDPKVTLKKTSEPTRTPLETVTSEATVVRR